ncbi:hypothetical protein JR316_0007455 [Psilocybe cubensis]|uniref:Uncharacterized protein n=2 Tax=Psilocybe cubensis TaxID=181762 RepID=A0ACB8GZ91_PSICU|nr:hypothetical protein JR316_0007455 [Psilocybe cubensis]KAH9480853.1 hypothetical protein JR316_0007455 [Psilocybe cubensis]
MDDTEMPVSTAVRPQLEFLHMVYPAVLAFGDPSFIHSTYFLDFKQLKTLKIAYTGGERPGDAQELCLVCPNVPHVYIDILCNSAYSLYNSVNYLLRAHARESLLDLSRFTALEHLTVEGVLKVRSFHQRILIDYFQTPIPWVVEILTVISISSRSAETLAKLTLKLSFIDFQLSLIPHLHINWVALCSTLAVRNFPNFVVLNLQITGLPPSLLAKLKEDEVLVEMQKERKLVYI